jgi:cytochrome c-type biogenesis protein CcmH/NrfG
MKRKENLVFVIVALIVGLLIGVVAYNLGGKTSQNTVPQQGSAPPATVNSQQQIQILQDVVAREPGNRNAWIQLGNNYFDSNQPVPAVDAYAKALELDGNDPNVLTDQGVMFRRLGWYDKAVENFEQASKLQPQHGQSLYNLGLVYMQDLKDFDKAAEAWERFLKVNPSGPGADQVRRNLEAIRSQQPMGKQ